MKRTNEGLIGKTTTKKARKEPKPVPYAALHKALSQSPAGRRASRGVVTAFKPVTLVDRRAPVEKPRVAPAEERNDLEIVSSTVQVSFEFHQSRSKSSALRSAASIVADFVDESSILAIVER